MRTTLIGLTLFSAVLWGCGDALPPSPDPFQGTGAYKLAFTEVPDGFNWKEKTSVVLTNPDGSSRAEVASGAILGPAGSNKVPFVRNDTLFVATWQNGSWNIRTIYAAGTPDDDLMISYASISISPDGRILTFTTKRRVGSNDHLNTYLAAADGSGIGLPLQVSVARGYTPVFSRDGRRLAFHGVPRTAENSFFNPGRLYVFNTDGSGYHSVVDFEEIGADGGVSIDFSPDGRKLLYAIKDKGAQLPSVYVANVDGSADARLIETGAFSPLWSRDGIKILYTGGFNYDIMMEDADGSGTPVNLTNTVGQIETFMQLSPDGDKLAYSTLQGDQEDGPAVIKVMDMDEPSSTATVCNAGFRPFWMPGGR